MATQVPARRRRVMHARGNLPDPRRPADTQLELGAHVLCKGGGSSGGPHVGEVVGHRTDAAGERFVLCRWYYRPEDAPAGREPFDGCSELLESDHVDIVPHDAVLGPCRVLRPAEFTRERDAEVARIRSARESEFFEREPVTDASRFAAEPWRGTFGDSPTADEVELMSVMHRLLRRVQAEVRPDECRRALENWLGESGTTPSISVDWVWVC